MDEQLKKLAMSKQRQINELQERIERLENERVARLERMTPTLGAWFTPVSNTKDAERAKTAITNLGYVFSGYVTPLGVNLGEYFEGATHIIAMPATNEAQFMKAIKGVFAKDTVTLEELEGKSKMSIPEWAAGTYTHKDTYEVKGILEHIEPSESNSDLPDLPVQKPETYEAGFSFEAINHRLNLPHNSIIGYYNGDWKKDKSFNHMEPHILRRATKHVEGKFYLIQDGTNRNDWQNYALYVGNGVFVHGSMFHGVVCITACKDATLLEVAPAS